MTIYSCLSEAEYWLKECLKVRGALLGIDHPDYADVMLNLASLYEKMKQ